MIMIAKKITMYYTVTLAAFLLAGCGHNIHVKGWGIASPCGAIGCGSFSCVKDNTTVEVTEKTPQMKSKVKFAVGDQMTGYELTALKSCGQQYRSTPDQPEQKR